MKNFFLLIHHIYAELKAMKPGNVMFIIYDNVAIDVLTVCEHKVVGLADTRVSQHLVV